MKKFLFAIILGIFPAMPMLATAAEPVAEQPDSSISITPYQFQYFLTQALVSRLPVRDEVADQVLMNPNILIGLILENGDTSPYGMNEIKAESVGEGTERAVVWVFPEPSEPPIALFVAFIPEGEKYRCYMLEKSVAGALLGDGSEGLWVIGSMVDRDHSNFGFTTRPASPAAFVEDVIQRTGPESSPDAAIHFPK